MSVEQQLLFQFQLLPEPQKNQLTEFANWLFEKYSMPKSVKKKEPKKGGMQLGTMPGLVKFMADDFNEPLEEFKDYM